MLRKRCFIISSFSRIRLYWLLNYRICEVFQIDVIRKSKVVITIDIIDEKNYASWHCWQLLAMLPCWKPTNEMLSWRSVWRITNNKKSLGQKSNLSPWILIISSTYCKKVLRWNMKIFRRTIRTWHQPFEWYKWHLGGRGGLFILKLVQQ